MKRTKNDAESLEMPAPSVYCTTNYPPLIASKPGLHTGCKITPTFLTIKWPNAWALYKKHLQLSVFTHSVTSTLTGFSGTPWPCHWFISTRTTTQTVKPSKKQLKETGSGESMLTAKDSSPSIIATFQSQTAWISLSPLRPKQNPIQPTP